MKRKKLAIGLVSAVLCLGLLAFGVWAAITQTFNFDAQVSFNAEGVYVDIDGSIYRGETYTELHQLTSDESYEVHAKNYVADEAGNRIGNAYVDVWKPADVAFLPTARIVQYRIKFTNKSEEAISVIPSEVTTIPTNVTLAEESSATLYIEPSETAELRMNFTLADSVTTSFSAKSLQMNFDIYKTSDIETTSTYLSISNNQLLGMSSSLVDTPNVGLRAIVIPSTVTSMKDGTSSTTGVFNGLQSNCKYLIFQNGLTNIGAYAFYNNTNIVGVSIPASVKAIGAQSFYGCTSLASAIISEETTSIGASAFYNCKALLTIKIPNSVTNIGTAVFSNCSSLKSASILADIDIVGSLFSYCSTLASVNIPASATNIGDAAFRDCKALTELNLPSNVQEIGLSSLWGCTMLKITVDENNNYFSSLNGTLYNKDKTTLVRGAGAVSTISDIPNTVKLIQSAAFAGCSNLTSVNLPDGVERIGNYVFQDCTMMTTIAIPSSVTLISHLAFNGCTALTSIYMEGDVPAIASLTFGYSSNAPYTNTGFKIYVKSDYQSNYKPTSGYSENGTSKANWYYYSSKIATY